jgi:UTP:GlnB (protein PII) uridylyltransferase
MEVVRMCAHHATAPVGASPAFDAPMDPWLRMRLAPVRARRPTGGGATVRDALRTITSVRPNPALLASALRPVRALLERERGRLRQRLRDGAPTAEIARAEARLLDGTLIGLCHVGRLLEPRPVGMVPPLAVIARGDYGQCKPAPGASVDLLFLVASDPVRLEQGLAIAQFVARELAGLGWQASVAKRTVPGCLAETHLDPAIASGLSGARLVWGCHGLFAELRAGVAQTMPGDQAQPAWRPRERSADLVLAA